MTQQSFYENVAPITQQRHGNYSIQLTRSYAFTQSLTSIPLMAVEFAQAVNEYTIVFVGDAEQDTLMPVVLVGIKDANSYLNETGEWQANYVPAYVRQYPFLFANTGDDQLTLCIDEAFDGCNEQGQGEPLFNQEGEPSPYLQSRLEFLKDYRVQSQRTKAFCRHLHELGLLESLQASLKHPSSGEGLTLRGFMGINRDKLKELSGEQLVQLVATGEMELIYLHLQSIRNLRSMQNLFARTATEFAQDETPAAVE